MDPIFVLPSSAPMGKNIQNIALELGRRFFLVLDLEEWNVLFSKLLDVAWLQGFGDPKVIIFYIQVSW